MNLKNNKINDYFCCNINEADKEMANKEKIDYLLLDIRELETRIAGMRNAEIYPVSFFGQTFNLTHKILQDLHSLETMQIEMLRKQMEEHQALIQSIPHQVAAPMPEVVPAKPETPAIPERQVLETVLVKEEVAPIIDIPECTTQPPAPVVIPEPIQQVPAAPDIIQKAPTPERAGLFLNDLLAKKSLSDFRKAFSLNDRFRFRRELFGGDEERMNKAISDLNEIHTYEDSVAYLNNELKWNIEDQAVADFMSLLEKRFL